MTELLRARLWQLDLINAVRNHAGGTVSGVKVNLRRAPLAVETANR